MHDVGTGRLRPLVLIVDDDDDLRKLAQIQLAEGFDVIQAPNGEMCLALASQERPDVILLDMMMPGMDGAQVLNRLSASPSTKDIPVIFLSALTGVDEPCERSRERCDRLSPEAGRVHRAGSACRCRRPNPSTAPRVGSACWPTTCGPYLIGQRSTSD